MASEETRGGRRRPIRPLWGLLLLGMLRSLARRIHTLDEEIALLGAQLDPLVEHAAPTAISRLGIGTGHTAQLLVMAGQNLDRLGSEAAFARLCGAAPVPVS